MDVLDTNKYLDKEGLAKVWELIKQYVRDKISVVNVTYKELKSLRDNSQLIPGQQYRITDYETTTSQAGTTSANHPFDILVTALDESTLSENASAIKSARDTENYFGTENLEAWQLKYCLDNDTDRFAWADNIDNLHKAEFVALFWDDPVNGINYNRHIDDDKIYDWGTAYDPETEMDNIVIYKSDTEIYKEEGLADYSDKYFYRGVVEVDGEEYDSWKKYEDGEGDWVTNGDGQYQYALTERIVFDGQVIWPELKPEIIRIYDSSNCVIKDEYDGGSVDYGYNALSEYIEIAAIMMDDPVNGDPYEALDKDIFSHFEYETEPNGGYSLYLLGRYLDDGEDSGLCEDQKYYYRGVVSVNGSDFDCWQKCDVNGEEYEIGLDDSHKYYFLTNKIVDGEVTIIESEKPYGGKGVIYNMIDEYGNECPYDFKNIKFYHEGSGRDVYTFTWIDDSYKVIDASVFGNNGTLTYYGEVNGVYGNVIKPYMEIMYQSSSDYIATKQLLNNITFISNHNYEFNGNDGFYGCYSNSFGNDCCHNSFGNYCYSNNFGDGCSSNSFGNNCNDNSFSNNCYSNIFGDGCSSNSFGNICRYNKFGDECQVNSFGNSCDGNSFIYSCFNNSFGNVCSENSFGRDCTDNSFGNYCKENSFGNSCIDNSLDNNCFENIFGESCHGNSFGEDCYSNSFGENCVSNSFGNACDTNSLGNSCRDNSFGNRCSDNSLSNTCYSNSFGNSCKSNSFGYECENNSFGNSCDYNSFGNSCSSNSFGNDGYRNSFGNDCKYNSFGNDCNYNSFRLSASKTETLLNYCWHNHFDDGCSYNVIWNSVQPTDSNKLQNINVVRGVSGKSSKYNFINIVDKNADYEIKVAKNSKGEIKIYCEADLIK